MGGGELSPEKVRVIRSYLLFKQKMILVQMWLPGSLLGVALRLNML